jgi:maleate cis-trans isomerase
MAFECWRGVVGIIKPTMRPGGLEDMIRMLPEGVGVLGLYNDIRRGTVEEFEKVMADYDANMARLADQKVDMIHPEGAPPFMVQGLKGEAKRIRAWERKYGIPVFTSGTNHIRAMKALKIRTFVGATYFPGAINDTFSRYFRDAGFEPLAMEGIDVKFDQVQNLSSHQVYAHVKRAFLKHPKADGIYMLGSGWQVLDVIDMLERDLGVPVVHPIPARVWEIQRRLRIFEPREGFGRLLATMPKG